MEAIDDTVNILWFKADALKDNQNDIDRKKHRFRVVRAGIVNNFSRELDNINVTCAYLACDIKKPIFMSRSDNVVDIRGRTAKAALVHFTFYLHQPVNKIMTFIGSSFSNVC